MVAFQASLSHAGAPSMKSFHRLFMCSLLVLCMRGALAPRSAHADDWPQWRGPNRDGISLERGLVKEWPAEGPSVLWQVDRAGVGYSSLALSGGRIFTQGDLDGVEHIIALDVKDGHVLWAVQPAPVVQALAARI